MPAKLPPHPKQYFYARVLELYGDTIPEDSSTSDTRLIQLLALRGLLSELGERARERNAPRLVILAPCGRALPGPMDGAA